MVRVVRSGPQFSLDSRQSANNPPNLWPPSPGDKWPTRKLARLHWENWRWLSQT